MEPPDPCLFYRNTAVSDIRFARESIDDDNIQHVAFLDLTKPGVCHNSPADRLNLFDDSIDISANRLVSAGKCTAFP